MSSIQMGSERRAIIGAWSLVSFTANGHSEARHPLGDEVHGMLIYTPQGFMAAQLAGSDGYMGYAGTYEWHGSRVVHRTVVGNAPQWDGAVLHRSAELKDRLLTLRAEDNGMTLTATWQRLTPGPETASKLR
ncbi:lipocalin-like domain-containing protein [Streptomyces sp. NPDC056254]|uniref:lipocalin-like domain-containing protein n=1 Tax=Streptomyces sp. NPDC056254 TaxID=3345763 RepID=UPI0035DF56E2